MWIMTSNIAEKAVPGQFISVYTKDASKLLPRPISICETEGRKLRIVYRVVGGGTTEFSTYKEGESIHILGPIGNGFLLKRAEKPFLSVEGLEFLQCLNLQGEWAVNLRLS